MFLQDDTPKLLYFGDSETCHMTGLLVVDGIVDFLAGDPVFTGLLVLMLLFVFFAYLLVRRTLLGLREGYDDARKR
ncbi:hypothetical protein C453_03509 [Haloferax elongans ATCC BAA-1513]|uniref:Uncharacterized protein n=2 Tax=Haloferax TaxID=2251 RepID=M0HSB5_HALEO|nr:hypothetical protein C455_15503 [Haloferax larsenii JCM 13917]ELZ87386.1 hypothetical protein C453_03509 [Haloferax elongans ATCC BAA-1513]